jgi:hypothetical protein
VTAKPDLGRSGSAEPSGFRPTDGAASVSTADAASIPNAFDPSCFEYRFSIRDGRERHDWIASGEYGAIGIWAEPSTPGYGERWYGGVEGHSRTPAEYQDAAKPSQELCWLLLAPCWHDGSSLQFSEQVEHRLPWPTGNAMSGDVLEELRPLLRRRYRDWLAEPASAIEAGTDATGTGAAEGESAPEGDAQ